MESSSSADETMQRQDPTMKPCPFIMDYVQNEQRYKKTTMVCNVRYIAEEPLQSKIIKTMLECNSGRTELGEGTIFPGKSIHNGGVFLLKSPQGTGKTTLMKALFSMPQMQEKKVIYVSCRVSFSRDVMTSLQNVGFVNYKDTAGCLDDFDRVIVSLESLKRLIRVKRSSETPELRRRVLPICHFLVIDESETIFDNVEGKTMDGKRGLYFTYIVDLMRSLQFDTTTILIDGMMTEHTLKYVKLMTDLPENETLAGRKPKDLFFVYNCCRPVERGQIEVIQDDVAFFSRVEETVKHLLHGDVQGSFQGEWGIHLANVKSGVFQPTQPVYSQVLIAHGSVKKLKAYYDYLLGMMGKEFEPFLISCDSTVSPLNSNVHLWVSKFIIQYTSTIAAGVNYDPRVFRDRRRCAVFIHTERGNINADSMTQMAFRARPNIVSKYTFFVKPGDAYQVNLSQYEQQRLLEAYDETGDFLNDPTIARETNAYYLETAYDAETKQTVFIPLLMRDNPVNLTSFYNIAKKLMNSHDYYACLIRCLSDMSDEWFEEREKKIAEGRLLFEEKSPLSQSEVVEIALEIQQRNEASDNSNEAFETPVSETFERIEAIQEEATRTSRKRLQKTCDQMFAIRGTSLKKQADQLALEAIRKICEEKQTFDIASVIEEVDQSKQSIVMSSSNLPSRVRAFEILKVLMKLAMKKLPREDDEWELLQGFWDSVCDAFDKDNIDFILRMNEKTTTNKRLKEYEVLELRETCYHASKQLIREQAILETLHALFPGSCYQVSEDDEARLLRMFLICFDSPPTEAELSTTESTLFTNYHNVGEANSVDIRECTCSVLDLFLRDPMIIDILFDHEITCVKHRVRAIRDTPWNQVELKTKSKMAVVSHILSKVGLKLRKKSSRNLSTGVRSSSDPSRSMRTRQTVYAIEPESLNSHKALYCKHVCEKAADNLILKQFLLDRLKDWPFVKLFLSLS